MCQDSIDQSAYSDLLIEEKFDDDLYKYLCDNHCHPHDDVDKLDEIAKLRTGHLTLMGVREQDWDTVKKVVDQSSIDDEDGVERCIPSFGVHPWYAHLVRGAARNQTEAAEQHYNRVLTSKDDSEKADLIQHLPTPSSDWLRTLRANLEKYPHALVGEVGFDRSARLLPAGAEHWHGVRPTEVRCTPEHQLEVVSSQIELARDLNRSVSLHCVQAHGMVLDLLLRKANEWRKKDMKTPFRICLHSYGGSPGILPSLFDIKRPVKVYMSFSVAINGRLGNKLLQLIEKVPDDRVLIESDYNTPTGIDDAMVDITKVVAKAKKWSIQQVVEITRRNWLEFINISAPSGEHRA
ncbi:hypothetical protein K450DRAFT_280698 [Umbelopsis ramanniana AG]|uniref:Metallo-dependent hydrolase n=1 Tax=Umbelopsis ramanniana AG TaxID=1314678 RepID=A0AAD5HCR5_UMBRA|nr:uncharacterized protein K450DRAFT_280698 [Umbelopsis ramanniana AG]KAI8579525.1 hypothetical protein K450DRAFT_280698 [Umbelopsis ramanniana AG]